MAKNYPPHLLLSWGGSIGAGEANEEFTNTLRLVALHGTGTNLDGPAEVVTPTVDQIKQYLNNTAVDAISEFFARPSTAISGAAKLEWIKLNPIKADGKYANDETIAAYDLNVAGGGHFSLAYPLQISVAVTWETDKNRGLANRGRIYLPAPTQSMTGAGTMSTAQADALRDSAATLLTDLGNYDATMGLRFVPSVVSGGGKFNSQGTRETITGVSVDTRFDVQRRRAEQQNRTRTIKVNVEYSDGPLG